MATRPAKAHAPSLHPLSWLAAGLPAIKAIESLAAAARAAGDISQLAAIASVAASLKCLIGSARAVLQAFCETFLVSGALASPPDLNISLHHR